jgi:regulator of replication initiation timing
LSRVVIEGERLKELLAKLEDARKSVDDLIDTFEMLQDENFQKELRESLSEAERGETLEFGGVDELRKESTRG